MGAWVRVCVSAGSGRSRGGLGTGAVVCSRARVVVACVGWRGKKIVFLAGWWRSVCWHVKQDGFPHPHVLARRELLQKMEECIVCRMEILKILKVQCCSYVQEVMSAGKSIFSTFQNPIWMKRITCCLCLENLVGFELQITFSRGECERCFTVWRHTKLKRWIVCCLFVSLYGWFWYQLIAVWENSAFTKVGIIVEAVTPRELFVRQR